MACIMEVLREGNHGRWFPWLLRLPSYVGLTGMPTPCPLFWKSNWGDLFFNGQWSRLKMWLIWDWYADKLREHVISISADNFHIFHGAEVEEVRRAVYFVIELFGIGQLQFITHVGGVANTCETKKFSLLKLISDHDKGDSCDIYKPDVKSLQS